MSEMRWWAWLTTCGLALFLGTALGAGLTYAWQQGKMMESEKSLSIANGEIERLQSQAKIAELEAKQPSLELYYRGSFSMCRIALAALVGVPKEEATLECLDIVSAWQEKKLDENPDWNSGWQWPLPPPPK
jgi:hypothetical protein